MLRFMVRKEMVESKHSSGELCQFDALSQEQFELWFKMCYEGPLAKAYPEYK